jgi:transglycosylase-like protein
MTRRGAVRVILLASVAAAGLAAALALRERPALELRVRQRIEAEAMRHGLVARIDSVRVGLRPPILLTGLRVEKPGQWSLAAETASVTLRVRGRGLLGRTRLALGRTTVAGPGGLTLDLVPTVWDLAGDTGAEALELRQPATGLTLTRRPSGVGTAYEARAQRAPLGSLLVLRREGAPLLDAGIVDGRLAVVIAPDATSFDVDAQAHGMKIAAAEGATAEDAPPLGPPADVRLSLAGSWRGPEGRLEVSRWQMITDGVSVSGSLLLDDVPADPRMTMAFEVERVDLARLLALSALEAPVAVSVSVDDSRREGSLGSASLSASVTGRLADAASFSVTQRLDFTPPRRTPPQIERLRRDFVHEVTLQGGERKLIDVSPASPDFIPIREVPPLLVQTLLLGEDAGFFGHQGIDLSELPSAILTNWSRGMAARGASTITQQLAKNLFLSSEKHLGRKLQELALALLLESTLGKQRMLEIYLNVIEWGPGVYGLRPAARQYFGMEPSELAPAQMALLVALIPGPVKYQRSLAAGTPSPGFRPLVDRLLAKLRSVDALTEEEYQTALADDLHVAVPGGAGE